MRFKRYWARLVGEDGLPLPEVTGGDGGDTFCVAEPGRAFEVEVGVDQPTLAPNEKYLVSARALSDAAGRASSSTASAVGRCSVVPPHPPPRAPRTHTHARSAG